MRRSNESEYSRLPGSRNRLADWEMRASSSASSYSTDASAQSVVVPESQLIQIKYLTTQALRCKGEFELLPDQLLAAAIRASPIATICLDADHRVRLTNTLAASILDRRDSFDTDVKGFLRPINPSLKRSFDQYLGKLSESTTVQSDTPARYLLTRSPLPPLSVTGRSWKGKSGIGCAEAKWAILYLRDPSIPQLPSHDDLRAWFDFTKAEARLACAIASGKTSQDYSSERGVSLNTVKTQFQSILDKTRMHRQVDLVRLLGSL